MPAWTLQSLRPFLFLCVLHVTTVFSHPVFKDLQTDKTYFKKPDTLNGRDVSLHGSQFQKIQEKVEVLSASIMDGGSESDKTNLKLAQEDLLADNSISASENVNNSEAAFVDPPVTQHRVMFGLNKQAVVPAEARASEEMMRNIKSRQPPNVRLIRQVPQTNTISHAENGNLDREGMVKGTISTTNIPVLAPGDEKAKMGNSRIPGPGDVLWTKLSNKIPTDIPNGPVPNPTFSWNPYVNTEFESIDNNIPQDPNPNTASTNATSDNSRVKNLSLRNLQSDSHSNKRSNHQELTIQENTQDPSARSRSVMQASKTVNISSPDQSQDNNLNDTDLTISLAVDGDSMLVSWTFDNEKTEITGFEVSYRMNSRERYDSSRLEKQVRSFTLHSLHADEEYVICVHAMVNNTIVRQACADWSEASMKMVIGIMAGTIFLVPCIAVIIWILHKDRKMKDKYAAYDKVEEDVLEGQDKISTETQAGHSHCHHKQEITHNKHGKRSRRGSTSGSSTDKSLKDLELHDTGHENPCTDTDENDDSNGPWKRRSQQETEMRAKTDGAPKSSNKCHVKTTKKTRFQSAPTESNIHQPHKKISDETTPKSDSSTTNTPSIPNDSLALSVTHLPKSHLINKKLPSNGPAKILVQKSDNDIVPQPNGPLSIPGMSTNIPLPTSAFGSEVTLQAGTPGKEQSVSSHPGDLVIVTAMGTSSKDSDEGTKL